MKKPIRVLIIDDSAVVRLALTEVLESDPDIEVMGSALDPFVAVRKMREEKPDVITLDVEMPRMDGLTFLQKLMRQHPIPVVMCSSLTEKGCETALRALEYGAVDIITKPKLGIQEFIEDSKVLICDTVKAAAKAQPTKRKPAPAFDVEEKRTADAILPKQQKTAAIRATEKIVVVGASTGGTEAIKQFLISLPLDAPGIVVVQHMPERFTQTFAQRLDDLCAVKVKEAVDGETIIPGTVLIAPGNQHVLVKRSGTKYFIATNDGPLVSRHRPSVDVLFRSAAQVAGPNAIAVILTGMGDDGAQGMAELKESGAQTIAQDESTSVVFGMPKEAINRGGVNYVLPLPEISSQVLYLSKLTEV